MAAPLKEEVHEEAEDWLTTYADAITLLMAFFVMLLTFAEFDIPAYEELSSAIANNIGGRDAQTTSQSLKIDVQDMVYNMQADQVISVGTDEKGVVIELQSSAFFHPGSADIVAAALPVLKDLAATLAAPRYELYNVVVEGHTDDGAINTPMFPSNWELSASRASAVVRLFETNNVDRSRLEATGYADTRPKVANRDLEGQPIPENRATNRRVVLRLHPMSIDERAAYLGAQEYKRRQAEAKAKAVGGSAVAIETRLPIVAAPDDLNEQQLQTKSAIDALKREIHTLVNNNGRLNAEQIADIRAKLTALSSQRVAPVEPYFAHIEKFLGEEQKALDTPQPQSAN